ncbi:5'-3' exonuclease [Agromyces sp. ISL-38]|uniref:5'-3' exonuclease n=1 Tax=Agromyces sp. ISL-38 TaxID=2819107 RepID=UPI001BE847EA|nr:5'-3' exonuclease [Agromyces sp. ISL-38]MBT2499606.1 5'-3' exonuclease [Agromyces sp. ISL-38]
MSDRLMLLDTASLYFRAFYGVPDTIRAPDGTPVNAVRGLLDIIARLVAEYEPTHLVACWDDDWRPHWRVDLIPSYKAHRVAEVVPVGPDVEVTPDPLEAQIPMIRQILDALDIPIVGAAHHEADDVIGSLATQATMPVDVVTGDRDLFQLVDDASRVRVIYTARGMSKLEVVTDVTVVGKYGVLPSQYVDFSVLRGDTSDGLPGVAGIGEKTAASLLQQFVDLDALIAAAADPTAPLSATIRARMTGATDYLAVAPKVVEVVRDLELGEIDGRIRPLDAEAIAEVERLANEWNLGGSAQRALRALGNGVDAY